MSIAVKNILRKVFVQGFYRTHAGMFIFLFAVIFSSCFFVNTLGELPPGTYFFWHFIITVTLVSNPVMIALFLLLSLFYAFKGLQFIHRELQKNSNLFLFYSINAMPVKTQLRVWFFAELSVFLPLIIYTLFSVVIGFITRYYLAPVLIVIYVIALVFLCACNIVSTLNKLSNNTTHWFDKPFQYRKPFSTLYTHHVLHKQKSVFFLTKLTSLAIIPIIFYNYTALKYDLKTSCIVIIFMMSVHLVLVYREQDFNNRYLSFAYNFPYSMGRLFFGSVINYLFFLAPEIIWMFAYFNPSNACVVLLSGFSFLLLMRSISFSPSLHLFSFLKIIFLVLCLLLLLIMYNFYWVIAPFCSLLSYIIFRENYFYKNPS